MGLQDFEHNIGFLRKEKQAQKTNLESSALFIERYWGKISSLKQWILCSRSEIGKSGGSEIWSGNRIVYQKNQKTAFILNSD